MANPAMDLHAPDDHGGEGADEDGDGNITIDVEECDFQA
jgi:hypothetical protein